MECAKPPPTLQNPVRSGFGRLGGGFLRKPVPERRRSSSFAPRTNVRSRSERRRSFPLGSANSMRYDDDHHRHRRRRRAAKHSGFGIASFVVAIAAGLAEFSVCVVGFGIGASNPNGIGRNSPLMIVLALGVCFASVGALTGVGLGIVGLCQTRSKNTFAVLGLILNGLVLA